MIVPGESARLGINLLFLVPLVERGRFLHRQYRFLRRAIGTHWATMGCTSNRSSTISPPKQSGGQEMAVVAAFRRPYGRVLRSCNGLLDCCMAAVPGTSFPGGYPETSRSAKFAVYRLFRSVYCCLLLMKSSRDRDARHLLAATHDRGDGRMR